MENLMNLIVHNTLKVQDFLSIMEYAGFPFNLDESAAADFFISTGENANISRVVMCLPSCFEVAEYIIKKSCSDVLPDIKKGTPTGKILKNLNMRDILLEVSHSIYLNKWEVHTVLDIGETQRFILSLLARYGYVNDEILDPSKFVYHHELLKMAEEKGAAIRKIQHTNNGDIPCYYMSIDLLSTEDIANINAYVAYMKTYGNIIDDPEKCFWRIDTSHKVVDVMRYEEVKEYLNTK